MVSLRAVQLGAVVEDADTALEITELCLTAVGIGITARAAFAVGKAELTCFRARTVVVARRRVVFFATRLRHAAPVVHITPVAFTACSVRVACFEAC